MLSLLVLQTPGLNIITEYMMGYIYPGRPIANVCFKTYGYISMTQAVSFLSDFKLGHYMKIPPRAMFHAQVNSQVASFSIFTIKSNLINCISLSFLLRIYMENV